jgi:Zn-dependent peptidase ImmA (M78 family)/transcriptional regulator with XRE-family HTH domain
MEVNPSLISQTFDGNRLRQARQLAMMTKQGLATALGVSAAAVSQYESGVSAPRPELISVLAHELDVRPEFFTTGRPQAHLSPASAFFRSLRSTTAKQRSRSTAYTEQLWELVEAIEKHVQLPEVSLPGFSGGEIATGSIPCDPVAAAQMMRKYWRLSSDPIPHLVRFLETKGIVTVIVPDTNDEVARIDAFSTMAFSRPIIILSLSHVDDVYRHRFTAAHELGHLVLHGESATGDSSLEREADRFAAEFLTPGLTIHPELPKRIDFKSLDKLSRRWGVSLESLVRRSREIGNLSEVTVRRAYMRLNQLRTVGVFQLEPVRMHPGEVPAMLPQAVALAEQHGMTIRSLADQLMWKPAYLRQMLGAPEEKPVLRLVPND